MLGHIRVTRVRMKIDIVIPQSQHIWATNGGSPTQSKLRHFLKKNNPKQKGSFSQVEDSHGSPADRFQQGVFCQYMGTHM